MSRNTINDNNGEDRSTSLFTKEIRSEIVIPVHYHNEKAIATVGICLTEYHTDCQGGYIDFSNTYFIRCGCACHWKGEQWSSFLFMATTTRPIIWLLSNMFSTDCPSNKVGYKKVIRLVNNFKVEYGCWPSVTEVFYRSANEGIFPRTIESLRLVRRIALGINNLPKWTNFQWLIT